jgi:hypothetical protein
MPGDVLLFHGDGFISWAIRKFDRTEVNHAAIALDPSTLREAAGSGLRRAPIAPPVSANSYMHVRRHGERDLTPVLAAAADHLDVPHPYGYQQIILLALLASTRKIKLTGPAKQMLRSILDHAAAALNGFLDREGRRSMICSEFVYRVYREAVADPIERYRILVQIGRVAFDPTAQSLVAWALQPDDRLTSATSTQVSFAAAALAEPALADEVAEEALAPLIAEWAQTSGTADDDMPPPPAVSFAAGAVEEPTDEEFLSALVAFGGAYADSLSETPPSFGIATVTGVAAAKDVIDGLLTQTSSPTSSLLATCCDSPPSRTSARCEENPERWRTLEQVSGGPCGYDRESLRERNRCHYREVPARTPRRRRVRRSHRRKNLDHFR